MTDILDAAQSTSGPTPPAATPAQDNPASSAVSPEIPTPPPAPSPIEPSASGETNKSPADSDVMDALLSADQASSSPIPPISPITPITADNTKEPESPKKKSINLGRGVILSVLLLLFVTLPLIAYYASQQRRVAEIRSRASTIPGVTSAPYPGGENIMASCAGKRDVCKDQTNVNICVDGQYITVPAAPNECTNDNGIGSCTGKTRRCAAGNKDVNECGTNGTWESRPAQPGECDQNLPSVSCGGLWQPTLCANGLAGCTVPLTGINDCSTRNGELPPGKQCLPSAPHDCNSGGTTNYCDSNGQWASGILPGECGAPPLNSPTPGGSCGGKTCAAWETCATTCGSSPTCINIAFPRCPNTTTPPPSVCPPGQWPALNGSGCTPIYGGKCDGIWEKQITCPDGSIGCQNPFLQTTCGGPQPTTAYCSRFNKDDCINGCIADSSGGHCSTVPLNPSSSTPYCSRFNKNDCIYGCIADNYGGHCSNVPAATAYCTKFNKDDCINGCTPDTTGGHCAPATTAYCTRFNKDDCTTGCVPDSDGGHCAPATTAYCTRFNTASCIYGCQPTTNGGRCITIPEQQNIAISQSGCNVTNATSSDAIICTFSGGCEGRYDGYCGPSWDQINKNEGGAKCTTVPPGGKASCSGPAQVTCGSWQVDVSINGVPSAGISGANTSGCTTQPPLPPPPSCQSGYCVTTPPPGTGTPPPSGGQCNNIQVYKNGTLLTTVDLTKLNPGDNVNISVVGVSATQGRVRVNGGDWAVSTTKDTNGAFTVPFTVPTGTTNFTVEGQLFISGAWQ